MISAKEAGELYLKDSQKLMELELYRVESQLRLAMLEGKRWIKFYDKLSDRSINELKDLGYKVELVKLNERLLSDYYLIEY